MSVNRAILIGNLARDPELRSTNSGNDVCGLRVAVDRPPREGVEDKETDWLNVSVYGNQAGVCNEHLSKGSRVCIEGRVESRSWKDEDGNNMYAVEIRAFNVEFL